MVDNKASPEYLLSDKVQIKLYMFRFWHDESADNNTVLRLSHHKIGGVDRRINSASKDEIHVISATKCARLLYSASVLDLETTCCFLDYYEIKLEPKNTQNLDVDLPSSGSDAQSASQKPSNRVDGLRLGCRVSFKSKVSAKYLRIRLTACQ